MPVVWSIWDHGSLCSFRIDPGLILVFYYILNFQNRFLVTALELDLFSGAYRNQLPFGCVADDVWFPVRENSWR
jgi:hypothetical protein